MTKYQENFIYTISFIKKLLKIKMVTLLLGHPVLYLYYSCLPPEIEKMKLKGGLKMA